MKKEAYAAITIALLLIAAVSNVIHLSNTVADITAHIDAASQAGDMGNYVYAAQELKLAQQLWDSADTHTHTLLRHSDVDAIMESFHDAISAAGQGEYYSSKYAIETLRSRLHTVLGMEQVSLHSIF